MRTAPDVRVQCASAALPLAEYIEGIGDGARVPNMLVGDTQRIDVHADRGFAIPQPMPDDVAAAVQTFVSAGFTNRLVWRPRTLARSRTPARMAPPGPERHRTRWSRGTGTAHSASPGPSARNFSASTMAQQ